MAFVRFVFLMASSVLMMGVRLHNAHFLFQYGGPVAQQLGASTQITLLNKALQQKNQWSLEARESERQRLRDDLHDGVLGALFGIKMKLVVLELQPSSNSKSEELLSAIMRDLGHRQPAVRSLVSDLHTSALETLGLHGAIEQYICSHGGLRIDGLRIDGLRIDGLRIGWLLEVGPDVRDAGRGTRVWARLPLQALGNG
jgi:signal transduction histidine kinase